MIETDVSCLELFSMKTKPECAVNSIQLAALYNSCSWVEIFDWFTCCSRQTLFLSTCDWWLGKWNIIFIISCFRHAFLLSSKPSNIKGSAALQYTCTSMLLWPAWRNTPGIIRYLHTCTLRYLRSQELDKICGDRRFWHFDSRKL